MQTENTNKKERNYGIDLLRIFAMFLIVMSHINGHGGILRGAKLLSVNYEVGWFLEIFALCGTNCYALISGYVGYDSKRKYSNILHLYIQALFYALCITLPAAWMYYGKIDFFQLINIIFPFAFKDYWYFTAYFCLALFIPYLNILLRTLNKSQLKSLVLTLVFAFSVLPTVFSFDMFDVNGGYSALWLCSLYLIGGYLKKYKIYENLTTTTAIMRCFFCIFMTWMFKYIIEIATQTYMGEFKCGVAYNAPLLLYAAIMILIVFSKIKLNKVFNKITMFFAPVTFGVYLVHEEFFIKNFFMYDRFAGYANNNVFTMIFLIFGTALLIFLVCSLIDKLRYYLFKLFKVDKACDYISSKIFRHLDVEQDNI